jgi:DNA mismatch repair ATPase MutS
MAGKSTLLRAIGTNAVLTLAGAPIPADSARISPLKLCASLALTDSLADGKSKFLAEVERLHAILSVASAGGAAEPAKVLFLIDEIFSGTNSLDRCTAAQAIIHSLIAAGAIGALSTHDLALTEIATPALHGINVHMASPNPEDPLAFDYILKPGVNTSSSALAILRLIGLAV